MEITDPKFKDLCCLLEDYSDFLWNHLELREKLLYFVGRWISTGQDIEDSELEAFEAEFKVELEKYVKEKAN